MALRTKNVNKCTCTKKSGVRGRSLLGLDRNSLCCRVILILLVLVCTTTTNLHNDFYDQNAELVNENYVPPDLKSYKIKRAKSRIPYYANSIATTNIILCGDIEINPGPTAPKCSTCNKTIRSNSKKVPCNICKELYHQRCVGLSHRSPLTEVTNFVCHSCLHTVLPFSNEVSLPLSDTQQNIITETNDINENEHLALLNEHKNKLSIAHLNTQSLLSSFDEFSLMVNKYRFEIITVSETWLKENHLQESYVQIPGYSTFFKHRDGKKGGGVAIYIKDHYTVNERKDIGKIDTSIENLWIEVKGRNKNTPYLVGVLYQPSSIEAEKLTWLDKFDSLLNKISLKWYGTVIITGDFNIDLLRDTESTQRYKAILESYSFTQHIKKPTRNGKTLIDHISTNITKGIASSEVLPTGEISDHDSPYAIFQVKKQRYEPRYKWIRNEKNLDMKNYIDEFKQLPLNIVYGFDDPDDQLNALCSLITGCINDHAPLRKVKLTRPPAPWMNDPKITTQQMKMESIRLQMKHDKDDTLRKEYTSVKKSLRKSIKIVKGNFLRKALSDTQPKAVWNTVHNILKNTCQKIKHDPDALNHHYCTLASRLTDKPNVASINQKFVDELPCNGPNAFKLSHTSYEEVCKIIQNLKNDCSTGQDNIPVRFIKPVSDFITSPLAHIINNCIDKCIFPDAWKIARICPIPKVDNPTKPADYRPISVLPIFSKVYERVILKQLSDYIETNRLYQATQSGFRKGHSTTTILSKLRDDIRRAMNKSEVTIALMIDFSKAFDTVDHRTLLLKLHHLNFSRDTLKLILDYLSDRKQFVQVDDKSSDTSPIYFGVPQGSILGPVLFNLYVHNLQGSIASQSMQYADDTTIYAHTKPNRINNISEALQGDLNKLRDWSSEQNLLFNDTKTKLLLFSTPQLNRVHNLNATELAISCGNSVIERSFSTKILGMTFDENLTWKEHITSIIKNANSTLRSLRLVKRFTPLKVRKALAQAMVLSLINYGNSIYGHDIPQHLVMRLQKTQNSAASYVLGRYAKEEDNINLGWLPIKEQIKYSTVILTFKALNDERWPSYLKVEKVEERRRLRNSDEMKVKIGEERTFSSHCKHFNELPKDIRLQRNVNSFKAKAKKFFKDEALARILSSKLT